MPRLRRWMPAAEDVGARAVGSELVTRGEVPGAERRLNGGEDGLEALDANRHEPVAAIAGDRLDLAELIDPEGQLRVAARVRADEFDLEHGTKGGAGVGRSGPDGRGTVRRARRLASGR